MGPLKHFFEYAQDFEKTYDDDDWSRLERYFARDAVYEVRNTVLACRLEGVDTILRGIKKSLDGFDRPLGKRTIEIVEPPTEEGDAVTFRMAATYTLQSAPPYLLRGRVTARYRGGVIAELVDEYQDGTDAEAATWIGAHALHLGLNASYV